MNKTWARLGKSSSSDINTLGNLLSMMDKFLSLFRFRNPGGRELNLALWWKKLLLPRTFFQFLFPVCFLAVLLIDAKLQAFVFNGFHSQEWSILNFPCSITRTLTSHIMKNLAFHSLLRWEMIILPILTTSPIHFSLKRSGECTF